jgi:hypothetical protein
MNQPPDESRPPEIPDGEPPADMHHQQVQVPGATARVPSTIGSGLFSTGAIVMTGQHAFVLDFLQQMGVPTSMVSRLILPHAVMPQFIQALEHNIQLYQQKFGAIPSMPKPPQPLRRPSVQEIYENLKMSDDELPGHYADGVIIRHSPAEFCFDFVTHFYPHAAVARRIFVAAPHVPQLLQAMKANYDRFRSGPGGSPPARPPSP